MIIDPSPDPSNSFPDLATFMNRITAYTGRKTITLDGSVVRPGTEGQKNYYLHSKVPNGTDGRINATPPTN